MLEVRLFGVGHARYGDRPLPGFPNQQPYSLFCYLLLNRHHPHRREQLAAVFWSDYPSHISRKYLRDSIWRLRTALQSVGAQADDYLLVADESVSFARGGSHWLDVEVFEAAAAQCRDLPGRRLPPELATQLAEAVDLYTGDLLEGVYDDWCLYDREWLRLLYLNALSKLMAYHAARGAYECSLAYGERILAHDDTRETVHRQMMQLYWLLGERSGAVAQYRRCAQVLRETLGISPTTETRRLYRQMARGQCDPEAWTEFSQPAVTADPPADAAVSPLADWALQRLRRLEHTIEEARAELQHLERLLGAGAVDLK